MARESVLERTLDRQAVPRAAWANSPDLMGVMEKTPTKKVLEVMEDWDRMETTRQRIELLRLLARDTRFMVRRRVSEIIGAILGRSLDEMDDMIRNLVSDTSLVVREAAVASLRTMLRREGEQARRRLVSEWSKSSDPFVRLAVGKALAERVPIAGDLEALQVLAVDWVTEVREAAAVAARVRLEYGSDGFLRILQNLTKDNERSVRFAALDGLHQACREGQAGHCIPWLEDCVLSTDLPTAKKAMRILAVVAEQSPSEALASYDNITGRPDLADAQILSGVVTPVLKIASIDRNRARRILNRLTFHTQFLVSGPARQGLMQLGEASPA